MPSRGESSEHARQCKRLAVAATRYNAKRHAANRRKINAAIASGVSGIKPIARHTGISRAAVRDHLREMGVLATPKVARKGGRVRMKAANPAVRLAKQRMDEFHATLAAYERLRQSGVIDADMADDIAWMMENEVHLGVYVRHGVRYRVVAGELERDGNYHPAPRLYSREPKRVIESEASRANAA
jgi:hypothetical protein